MPAQFCADTGVMPGKHWFLYSVPRAFFIFFVQIPRDTRRKRERILTLQAEQGCIKINE